MGYRVPYENIVPTGNTGSSILDLNGTKYLILVVNDYNQNHVNNSLVSITQPTNTLKVPSYYSPDLPQSFNGLKIVQISDVHLGSFRNVHVFDELFDEINSIKPDIIVITGDMVNYTGMEAEKWIKSFQKLKAGKGKYSILGNHDYGDYIGDFTELQKKASTDMLVNIQTEMGFGVLRNQNICIRNQTDSIFLIGVENWSPSHSGNMVI